jgi:hypothetical protein
MSKDEITAMMPGTDLDAVVGSLIDVKPRIEWRVVDADETGIYCWYDSQHEAEHHLADIKTRFPGGLYDTEGAHVKKQELYPNFSASWDRLSWVIGACRNKGIFIDIQTRVDSYRAVPFDAEEIRMHLCEASKPDAPHAVCIAAALAILNQKGDAG